MKVRCTMSDVTYFTEGKEYEIDDTTAIVKDDTGDDWYVEYNGDDLIIAGCDDATFREVVA